MGRITAMAIAAATCAALLASGCAAAGSGSSAKGPATGSTTSPAATTTPEQQAKLAVTALLGDFIPPPGARKQSGPPASAQGRLDSVGSFSSGDEDQLTAWWLAPGEAQKLLGWEGAHLPRPFSSSFSSSGGGPEGYAYTQAYARPASGALTHQYLIMSVTDVAGGQVAIRVDADVSWQPVRPAAEKVPASAKVVTITLLSGGLTTGQPQPPPPPATITRPDVVARIAAVINGLQVYTGITQCMTSPPAQLKLVFSAVPGGPPLAVAQSTSSGCPILNLTVGGVAQPPLFFDGTTVQQIVTVASLHWKVP